MNFVGGIVTLPAGAIELLVMCLCTKRDFPK